MASCLARPSSRATPLGSRVPHTLPYTDSQYVCVCVCVATAVFYNPLVVCVCVCVSCMHSQSADYTRGSLFVHLVLSMSHMRPCVSVARYSPS